MPDLHPTPTPPAPSLAPGGGVVPMLADRCFDCTATPLVMPRAWTVNDGQVRCSYACVCGHVWVASWAADVLGGAA